MFDTFQDSVIPEQISAMSHLGQAARKSQIPFHKHCADDKQIQKWPTAAVTSNVRDACYDNTSDYMMRQYCTYLGRMALDASC